MCSDNNDDVFIPLYIYIRIIAAKSEYFGVGGGVGLFLNYVQRASNHFTVEVAGSVNAGTA